VPPVSEVGLLAHESVSAPRDDVRLTHGNLKTAARAQIRLLGSGGRDLLHVPRSGAFDDRASKT
jgi:hypothetical protein